MQKIAAPDRVQIKLPVNAGLQFAINQYCTVERTTEEGNFYVRVQDISNGQYLGTYLMGRNEIEPYKEKSSLEHMLDNIKRLSVTLPPGFVRSKSKITLPVSSHVYRELKEEAEKSSMPLGELAFHRLPSLITGFEWPCDFDHESAFASIENES